MAFQSHFSKTKNGKTDFSPLENPRENPIFTGKAGILCSEKQKSFAL
jgi:hypothetical protein